MWQGELLGAGFRSSLMALGGGGGLAGVRGDASCHGHGRASERELQGMVPLMHRGGAQGRRLTIPLSTSVQTTVLDPRLPPFNSSSDTPSPSVVCEGQGPGGARMHPASPEAVHGARRVGAGAGVGGGDAGRGRGAEPAHDLNQRILHRTLPHGPTHTPDQGCA